MMPMNAVAVAAGNIHSLEQVAELGYFGYDSVVLGRHIAEVSTLYITLIQYMSKHVTFCISCMVAFK